MHNAPAASWFTDACTAAGRHAESGAQWAVRPWLLPLLVYAAAAVVTTWPLVRHPATLLGAPVGAGDPYLNLWILGWGMHAVLRDPASLVTGRVFDANIFHPAAGTLAYSDHLLLQSAAVAPVFALTGNVVICYNVLLLLSLVASAAAMHAFIRSVVGTTGGAYLAGLAWGFGSYRFAHLLHVQLQALYFLPLACLFVHRLVAGRRTRDAVGLGVIAGLQALSSVYYAVIGGVGLVTALVSLAVVAAPRGRGALVRRAVLAGVIGAAIVVPAGVVYWRVQQSEGFGRNLYEASRNAAYVDSYLQAPPGNALYGRTGWLRRPDAGDPGMPPHTGPERELFPGFVLLALALCGVWLGRRSDARAVVVASAAVAAIGFVLSLGPDGVTPLYAALHRYVFGFQAIRAPARFAVLVMLGLCGLAAVGWRELALRLARAARGRALPRAAMALILAAAALEWLHVPVSLAPAPALHTPVGAWLRNQTAAGAVAVLPLGIDVDSTPAMVQSLEHRRPILNGYSGQRPVFYASLVDALSTFPSDQALVALRETDVRFVVTPAPVPTDPTLPLVERARFPDATIYELTWTPAIEDRLARAASIVPPPPGAIPFAPGETARYSVAWSGAGMNVEAGTLVLRVEGPPYRLVVEAATAPWISRLFEARDRFVTTTDAALLPQVHERDQNEGSRRVVRAFVFDPAARVVRIGRTVQEARAGPAVALPLAPHARDAIAALFYARTLPLDPGSRYRLPVNEGGRSLTVDLTVSGPERIVVRGRDVDVLRLEPRLQQQVQRRRAIQATLWVSADPRRVPVALDVDAGFGRVRAELVAYESGS